MTNDQKKGSAKILFPKTWNNKLHINVPRILSKISNKKHIIFPAPWQAASTEIPALHFLFFFKSVLFNNTIRYWDYIVLLTVEWMSTEHYWNDGDRVKPWHLEKTCPNSTLSTTNPKQTGLTKNTGLHGDWLVTSNGEAPYILIC